MQFFLSILIETIRLDFLLVIATINAIIFGYALSPLPKGEKIKNWRIPKMNKNVSTVTIKNLRYERPQAEWQVRVDRTSLLGNPFHMSDESQRNKVCDKYEAYFNWIMQMKSSAFYKEVERLLIIMKKHGKLELFCWCAPKRCHAETIKKYIENHKEN